MYRSVNLNGVGLDIYFGEKRHWTKTTFRWKKYSKILMIVILGRTFGFYYGLPF